MSQFSHVAAQVQAAVQSRLGAAVDMDAERQRVNSYIADVLKDSHVLYAKLARLQGDFKGQEAEDLFAIGQKVLALGDELSRFAKAFREGEAQMADTSFSYGDDSGGGGQAPAPAPEPEPEPEGVPFGEAPEAEEGEEELEEEEAEGEEEPEEEEAAPEE
jgi:hypothetical protein